MNCPWTEKTKIGCLHCQKKFHRVHESTWTPQGLPGGVMSPQGNLDSSDINWPALRFLIPKYLCEVIDSWPLPAILIPPSLTNSFNLDPYIAPELPELQPSVQSMNQCCCGHVWEKPLFGFKSFTSLKVLTSCKRPLGNEEDLEQGNISN